MKKLTGVVLLVIFAAGMAAAGTIDRILVKINDEIITLSELKRAMEPYRREIMSKVPPAQQEQTLKETEEKMLNNLIEAALIYQRAIEMEYNASMEKEVTEEIQQVMKENNFRDTEELENALAEEGTSLRAFRENLEKQIISAGLVNDFINSRISLLTPEIERYYQNHQEDFSTPGEVTLSEIILDTTKSISDAESLASDIANRIRRGEPFADLARQYSKGATAGKGGGIGTYVIDKLNDETRNALNGVGAGEISKPRKFAEGIIIYRVDARKEAVVQPLDEVRDEIKGILYQQKRIPEYNRFITQLREDAYIQIFPEMQ